MKIWTKSFSKLKRDVEESKTKSIGRNKLTLKKMLRWTMGRSQRRANIVMKKRMKHFNLSNKYLPNLWSKRRCSKSMKSRYPIKRNENIP
jgi:hypothetical protein